VENQAAFSASFFLEYAAINQQVTCGSRKSRECFSEKDETKTFKLGKLSLKIVAPYKS
jgi:hypothetical protein